MSPGVEDQLEIAGFDRATAVRAVAPGEWAVELDDRWGVGGGVNGGYLLATLARAAGQSLVGKPDPLAVAANYLAASSGGPAVIRTRVLREGRATAAVAATLEQGGVATVASILTMGTLGDEVPGSGAPEPPRLAPLDQCLGSDAIEDSVLAVAPFMQQVDVRADPAFNGWITGAPSGRPEVRSWMRWRDGREPDPLALLVAADGLPPVTFELGRFGWAPTIQLSVHLRSRPAPGWLRVTQAARLMGAETFDESCEVWDSRGRLVAQATQLAKMPR